MADNLFEGLPLPYSQPQNQEQEREQHPAANNKKELKCLKKLNISVPQKTSRFKTTDASKKQVIEAVQKIALHIKKPTKFGKASKLAIQMIQAGSVKPGTCDHNFAILEAAMSSPFSCKDPSVQEAAESLNTKQKNQLSTWTIRAVVANDLFTDDSFV